MTALDRSREVDIVDQGVLDQALSVCMGHVDALQSEKERKHVGEPSVSQGCGCLCHI